MFHSIDKVGKSRAVSTDGLVIAKGGYIESLATDAVGVVGHALVDGLISVSCVIGANRCSALVSLRVDSDVPTAALVAGEAAVFSIAKDTASKVNIYCETGDIKIQNKSAATIVAKVGGVLFNHA
jgi:hypothetical protein